MQPIKAKSFEEIMQLFEALSRARILMPKDTNTIFNLLNQIYTVMFPYIKKEDMPVFKEWYLGVGEEKEKISIGDKSSRFTILSQEWERELRTYAIQHVKEEEITLGGM